MLEKISFSLYFGKCLKVKWLHNRFLRDIWRHYDLLKAADINSVKYLLENTSHLKELSKGTRVFSNDGKEDLFNALSTISSIGVLVCSPYIFVVCRLANEYVRYTRYPVPTWWKWQWYSDSISKHWELFAMDYPKIKFKWSQGIRLAKVIWSSFPTKNIVPIFDEGELTNDTAQKIKFFIKDFFSKCDQIRSFLRIWSHFPKKSLVENFIFCAVWWKFTFHL